VEPVYMNENRYSYMVGSYKPASSGNYLAESPETGFERLVHSMYMEGQLCLHHEEYLLALNTFRELMALILHTANPQMPVDPNAIGPLIFPLDVALIDVFARKAAEILRETPIPYWFPLR